MNRVVGIIAATLLFVGFACADEGYDQVHLGKLTDVVTNAATVSAAKTTNGIPVSGVVESIVVNISGSEASPDIDIDIKTSAASGSKVQTTLFSIDDITADGVYPVRIPSVTTAGVTTGTTNSYAKIPLINDRIVLEAYDSNTNAGINVEAWLVIKK